MYVWIDILAGSESASHPHGSLNHFYGAFPCFPLTNHLALPGSESYLAYLKVHICLNIS